MSKLPKHICDKATSCNKRLVCLEKDSADLCKVVDCVNGDVHFIACSSNTECAYRLSFGDAVACTCPVRMELYNRYKI